MKLSRIGSAIAGAAALALVVTGCGSSSNNSASSAAASVQSAASSAVASATAAAGSALSSATAAAGSALSSAQSAVSGAVGDSQVLTNAGDGKLTIGIKFDQPGLGQKNPDGTFSGFDVEVAEYVAQELGVPADQITFVEAKSAEREGLIERGEVDYIVATYSITDSRKEKVNFAGPYFIAAQDLLVKADDTSITGPESLNGKNLCSVTGSTSAQKVKDNYAADVALQEYGTYTECVNALLASSGGPLDLNAVTTDNVILAGFAAQHPGELKVVGEGFSTENYGIGLKKGDEAGTLAINAAIAKMIASGAWRQALDDTVGADFTVTVTPTPAG